MGKFLTFMTNDKVIGITLAPFGIYIKRYWLNNASIITHEKIHWKQQVEMLFVFFYIWYVVEWFIKLVIYGRGAYYKISFEREARFHTNIPFYLERRKHFTWFYYIL